MKEVKQDGVNFVAAGVEGASNPPANPIIDSGKIQDNRGGGGSMGWSK